MKEYNSEKVEVEIQKISEELEPLIVKTICENFSLPKRAYYLTIDDLHIQYFGLGFCHILWNTKKKILKDRFQIDWKSPSDLNPETMFD